MTEVQSWEDLLSGTAERFPVACQSPQRCVGCWECRVREGTQVKSGLSREEILWLMRDILIRKIGEVQYKVYISSLPNSDSVFDFTSVKPRLIWVTMMEGLALRQQLWMFLVSGSGSVLKGFSLNRSTRFRCVNGLPHYSFLLKITFSSHWNE